jgi:hypothetical protein
VRVGGRRIYLRYAMSLKGFDHVLSSCINDGLSRDRCLAKVIPVVISSPVRGGSYGAGISYDGVSSIDRKPLSG